MATQIICPVCETRYEVKAAFPPEGRKARCSKCGHVWQAQPGAKPEPTPAAAAPSAEPFTVRCAKCGNVWQVQAGASESKPAAAAAAPSAEAFTVTPSPAVKPKLKLAPASTSPGLGGSPGVAQTAPPSSPDPSLTDRLSETETDAEFDASEDLADQVAQKNAQAAEESGGIYSTTRLSAAPLHPPHSAMSDAVMGDDAVFADIGLDPTPVAAMVAIENAEKRPRGQLLPIIMGWTGLGFVIVLILSALIFAPSAVTSVLPGASRLYALFGGGEASGLAFKGVHYGWTSHDGQTVLEVQGDVVNTSSTTVGVPTVVIVLRDESGEQLSESTTEVGEQELAAGEHTPFFRQIPSPPSSVRSVEVRLGKHD
jgi:predicted Zn finger-like uncharacterized protein